MKPHRSPRRPARSALRPSTEPLEPRLCMDAAAMHPPAILGVAESDLLANPHRLMARAHVHHPQRALTAHALHVSGLGGIHARANPHAKMIRRPPGYDRESLHEEPGPDREAYAGLPGHGGSSGPGLYTGIQFTSWTPPDDNIAVSNTEVVEAVNEQLAFFGKDGSVINSTTNIGLNTSLFPNPLGGSTFDPRIVFDPSNGGHFLLTALEQDSRSRTAYLDIAASRTDSPTTATTSDWYTYRIPIGQKFGSTATWMDFEGLGFDSQAIYVSGNMFGFGNFGSFRGVKIATFDKNRIESGLSISGPSNTKILTDGAFALQPAVTDGTAPAEYFIESWGSSQVRIHAITNPLGSMSYSVATVSVPSFGTNVPSAPQKGSTNKIATNDERMLNAIWYNGSLWAAHTIQNPSTGLATARWYQIGTNGMQPGVSGLTPSWLNSGNIDPGNGTSTFFPSITTDSSGDVAISYAESSSNEYPSASYAVMPAGSTSFTPASSPNIQAGAAPYGGSRWGDYSGVAADPSIPGDFYAVGEATQSNGNWGTWWTKTMPPPQPTPPDAPANFTATAESSGTILLSWDAVDGATGYQVYRRDSGSPTPTLLIQTAGGQTSVENTNVQRDTSYTYYVVATNSFGPSSPSGDATAVSSPHIQFQDSFAAGEAFPAPNWSIVGTPGAGAWSIPASGGYVSQTSTATADIKKAMVNGVDSSGTILITARVHIDSWKDGELARVGIGLFTDPSTGQGYNLVLTGRYSNTGAVNAIADPHVDFLDDLVAWGGSLNLATGSQPGYVLPNFQAGPNAPWYWFKLEMRDGVLYGSVWQDGTAEPATWMGSQAGWTDRQTGGPALNGGSSGRFNRVTSNSTASFSNVTVTG